MFGIKAPTPLGATPTEAEAEGASTSAPSSLAASSRYALDSPGRCGRVADPL